MDSRLPWDDISIRVSKTALAREYEKSRIPETTSACIEDCSHPCGACGDEAPLVQNLIHEKPEKPAPPRPLEPGKISGRLLIQYKKTGISSYLQHLSIVDAFNRAILISGIDVGYSEGFNPAPRLETAQPLPIAIESNCEIASILLRTEADPDTCPGELNRHLPDGLSIDRCALFPVLPGKKQRTIGSLEWGSIYLVEVRQSSTLIRISRY